jgi:hypothetical protein
LGVMRRLLLQGRAIAELDTCFMLLCFSSTLKMEAMNICEIPVAAEQSYTPRSRALQERLAR